MEIIKSFSVQSTKIPTDMDSRLLPVCYTAFSTSPVGPFKGGDCIITLSITELTISSPRSHFIASWRYSTIRGFSCTSTEFSFISGRRGPYGVGEYTFKIPPSATSSLYSILSKTTGAKIEYDADVIGCSSQPEPGNNLSYKVANSTFYINTPEDLARVTRNLDCIQESSLSSSFPPPRLSGHKLDTARGHFFAAPKSSSVPRTNERIYMVLEPRVAYNYSQGGSTVASSTEQWQSPVRDSIGGHQYHELCPSHYLQIESNGATSLLSLDRNEIHPTFHFCNEQQVDVIGVRADAKIGEGGVEHNHQLDQCTNKRIYMVLEPCVAYNYSQGGSTVASSTEQRQSVKDSIGGHQYHELYPSGCLQIESKEATPLLSLDRNETHPTFHFHNTQQVDEVVVNADTKIGEGGVENYSQLDHQATDTNRTQPWATINGAGAEDPTCAIFGSNVCNGNERGHETTSPHSKFDGSTSHCESWSPICSEHNKADLLEKEYKEEEEVAIGVVHHVIRPCSCSEYSGLCAHVQVSTEVCL